MSNDPFAREKAEEKAYYSSKKSIHKKDPTVSQYINENGGIKSPLDNKVYISENSYKEHLKASNHHIDE